MDYIYSELKNIPESDYTGEKTNTIEVIVDNEERKIKANSLIKLKLSDHCEDPTNEKEYILIDGEGKTIKGSARIGIHKNSRIKKVTLKWATEDEPEEGDYVGKRLNNGDPYLHIEFEGGEHLNTCNLKELVDSYEAGEGIIIDAARKINVDYTKVVKKEVENTDDTKSSINNDGKEVSLVFDGNCDKSSHNDYVSTIRVEDGSNTSSHPQSDKESVRARITVLDKNKKGTRIIVTNETAYLTYDKDNDTFESGDEILTIKGAKEAQLEEGNAIKLQAGTGAARKINVDIKENDGLKFVDNPGHKLLTVDYAKVASKESVDNEIERAKSAESGLDEKIDDETERAKEVESGLQKQIDDIESRSDVVDIVAVYDNTGMPDPKPTDLVHYNSSTISANDIVKVLEDNNESGGGLGGVSYYRLIIVPGSPRYWQLIHAFKPQATKEALDAEILRAETAESGLQLSIDIERTRAKSAESGLSIDIKNEVNRAKSVESGLQNEINIINSDAKIGSTYYKTIKDAYNAIPNSGSGVIEVLRDCVEEGIVIKEDKKVTIDFGFHKVSLGKVLAGDTSKYCFFQILKGSELTLRNGSLLIESNNTTSTSGVVRGFQNYGNLTLDNFIIDASSCPKCDYIISNNCGNCKITNKSILIASEGQRAFDVYFGTDIAYVSGVSASVDNTSYVKGIIEYGAKDTLGMDWKSLTKITLNSYQPISIKSGGIITIDEIKALVGTSIIIPSGYNLEKSISGDKLLLVASGKTVKEYEQYSAKTVDGLLDSKISLLGNESGSGEPYHFTYFYDIQPKESGYLIDIATITLDNHRSIKHYQKLIPTATTLVPGLLSTSDKEKVDSVLKEPTPTDTSKKYIITVEYNASTSKWEKKVVEYDLD